MKIHLSLAATATTYITTILVFLPATGQESSSRQIQNFRNSIRTHRCQKPSKLPLPAQYQQIEANQSWCGTIPKEIRSAAPTKRYINNNLEWAKLWKTYRCNEELPKLNFDREIVLLYVHFDANTVEMIPVLSNKGNLIANFSFTEVGMADSPCTYVFISVDRRGIKTIDGKAINHDLKRNSVGF